MTFPADPNAPQWRDPDVEANSFLVAPRKAIEERHAQLKRAQRYERLTDPSPEADSRSNPLRDAVDQWTGEVWLNLDPDEVLDWVDRGRKL